MPTVDFTLEDFRQLIRSEIRSETPSLIEQALIKERENSRTMMADEFNRFWERTLGPVLEEMQEDITVIKDTVKDHSFRIARLEGRVKRS